MTRKVTRRMDVKCEGCQETRTVNCRDWERRKSDYCKSCSVRIRVGLTPTADHSGKGTRLYNIWRGMRQRCGFIAGGHAHDVKHYADRGITVCDEWRLRFVAFKQWAEANGYQVTLLLDRKDNDIGYEPDNCRWVTVIESNRNKRSVVPAADRQLIREENARGVRCDELARRYGVNRNTITNIKKETQW